MWIKETVLVHLRACCRANLCKTKSQSNVDFLNLLNISCHFLTLFIISSLFPLFFLCLLAIWLSEQGCGSRADLPGGYKDSDGRGASDFTHFKRHAATSFMTFWFSSWSYAFRSLDFFQDTKQLIRPWSKWICDGFCSCVLGLGGNLSFVGLWHKPFTSDHKQRKEEKTGRSSKKQEQGV